MADVEALRARCAALEAEVERLREALEWADAMIWPRILMLERHNGDKPSEESEALRRLLGPIRRAHKHGEVVSMRQELAAKAALLRELAAAVRARREAGSAACYADIERTDAQITDLLRRAEAEAGDAR